MMSLGANGCRLRGRRRRRVDYGRWNCRVIIVMVEKVVGATWREKLVPDRKDRLVVRGLVMSSLGFFFRASFPP
jgi:hypothetical protein